MAKANAPKTAASKEAENNWDDAPAPGSQNPEDLKASQLMDAVDDLYGDA